MTHVLSGIDPRIRARRVAVLRAEGRRRLRFVLGALGVVAVCVGAWGLSRTSLLDLDHVRVEGIRTGSVAEVDAAVGVAFGAALMDVDTSAIATRVEALPWVQTADVRRDWPGTLRIDVVERVPVAVIPAGPGSVATVDSSSVVIGVQPIAAAPSLPLIDTELSVAPGEMQLSATAGLALVASIPDDLAPWVEGVHVEEGTPTTLVADLLGSATADFGDTALLGDKVASLRAVLAGVELACIARIDVSVADLPTVTPDPACEGRTPADDA